MLLAAGCGGGSGAAGAPSGGGSGGGGAGAGAQGTGGAASGGGGNSGVGPGAGGADAGGSADMAGGAGGASGAAAADANASDVPRTACEQVVAMVDRSCAADTDCIAVSHQTDFMGQTRLLGIRATAMARFTDLEKTCQPTMKSFSLPATTADDGSLITGMARSVACQGAVCTTYALPCGHPCAPGHICITCGTGAAVQSVCSQDCNMGPCTEPPRTQCLGGASLNGGEGQFCFDPMFNGGFMSSSCHR
ncbi:MAG TPA: hypothetical protein VMU50_19425 [Polyangia bacterium]|nr:hypothetical protein [Polyangia bacterium]